MIQKTINVTCVFRGVKHKKLKMIASPPHSLWVESTKVWKEQLTATHRFNDLSGIDTENDEAKHIIQAFFDEF